MFHFEQQDIKVVLKGKPAIRRWLRDLLVQRGMTPGEVTIIMVSDDSLLQINRESLGHDYLTDIITFDYSQDDIVSGDLFISLDTVLANSTTYDQPYEPGFECELCRVMAHGLLHMSGEDDRTPAQSRRMREAEDNALKSIAAFLEDGTVRCSFKAAGK